MIRCLMSKNNAKGSSYSSLFNNYIQGEQVLCNHAIVFGVLLHTDCVINRSPINSDQSRRLKF